MRSKRRLRMGCFSLLLPVLLATRAPVAAGKSAVKGSAPDLVTLGVIDGESDGKLITVTIRLDHQPTWSNLADIQDHGSFLQLTLPGTLVPEPGKFFDGGSKLIPKIAAFQLTPSDAGVRLFVSKDAAKIKQGMMAEILGSRIVLTIDAGVVETLLADQAEGSELVGPPAPPAITAEQIIAKTAVRRDDPAPSDLVKADYKHPPQLATGGFDLRNKLLQAAAFSAVMLVFLALSWAARPYLKKRRRGQDAWSTEAPLTIKTIASLNLAARQKVCLLQIGGDKVLIGITPEHVSFLTMIGAHGMAPGPSPAPPQHLAVEPQQLPVRTAPPRDFTQMLAAGDAVPLQPARTAKAAPVSPQPPNKDSSKPGAAGVPRAGATPSPRGASVRPKPSTGSRINVTVGEDGVKNLVAPRAPTKAPITPAEPGGQQAIDDVTRLIREKLKTLRSL